MNEFNVQSDNGLAVEFDDFGRQTLDQDLSDLSLNKAGTEEETNVIKLSKLRLLAVSSLMARSLFRFCRPF